jgi:hypothetical protein
MPFKRLKDATGTVENSESSSGDSDSSIIRPAILVHSGPEGEGVTYQSMDGETKPFDADRIKRIVENQNALLEDIAKQYGGWDKMPPGAFPPILDTHDPDSSGNVYGRMTSKLRLEVRDVPKVGKNVACAVTDLLFLGAENVQKVKDGRVYHLSVGIDELADTLGEISSVVEPAAPGAMLLSKGKKTIKGDNSMSKKSLQASKARMSKLSAMKENLTNMSSKLVTTKESVRLAKAEGQIMTRLTALARAGKLTPAEVKNLKGSQVKHMAALPPEMLETVMKSYEALETKVVIGQRGSSDASQTVDFGGMGKELERRQISKLKAQVRGEMKKLGAKLKEDGEDDKDHGDKHEMSHKLSDEAQESHRAKKMGEEHEERGHASPEMKEHLAKMAHHLEKGDLEGAKSCHAEMCKMASEGKSLSAMDDVHSEDEKKSMEALESELDEVKTNLARMAGMVDELMSSEAEEGHDFENGAAGEEGHAGAKA